MTAILPTGARLNPAKPEGAEYFDPDQVAYVMALANDSEKQPCRVWTSFGDLGRGWDLGTWHDGYHDQTGRFLGTFVVVGVATFKTGHRAGDVPDRKLHHGVFK